MCCKKASSYGILRKFPNQLETTLTQLRGWQKNYSMFKVKITNEFLIKWTEVRKQFFLKSWKMVKFQDNEEQPCISARLLLFFCNITQLLSVFNPLFSEKDHPHKCFYIAFLFAVFNNYSVYKKFAEHSSYIRI